MRHGIPGGLFLLAVWLLSSSALAQGPEEKKSKGMDNPVVARGVRYLQGSVKRMDVGEAALAALAMHKADLPDNDPAVQTALKKITARFSSQAYKPEQQGGYDNYEMAVVCLALTAIDPDYYKPQIEILARGIVRRQTSNGSWDYSGGRGGDSSMTQYCLLALWEAESIGAEIAPSVWDKTAQFFLDTQFPSGGWCYHPAESGPETVSMTAAGLGCLMICNDMLSKFYQAQHKFNPLLTPLIYEGTVMEKYARYKAKTSEEKLKAAVQRGLSWMRKNYHPSTDPSQGPSICYALYGMERTGALAGGLIGDPSWWYDPGAAFLRSTQGAGGDWNAGLGGPGPNTSWAILFLVKSTAKSIRKIELRRLGAGTLVGGRNLPPDLTNMTIAQGRVVVKPMNGAIDSMLAVLEDPRALNAESALAGLVVRFQTEGPSALKPFKDRFRRLIEDRDPGIRRVACWGLGRSGDLDVAPDLIHALMDPSGAVVDEARTGLQVLSRKLDSLGPPRGASAGQKLEAARKWTDWYNSIRSPDLPAVDVPRLNPVEPSPDEKATREEGQK